MTRDLCAGCPHDRRQRGLEVYPKRVNDVVIEGVWEKRSAFLLVLKKLHGVHVLDHREGCTPDGSAPPDSGKLPREHGLDHFQERSRPRWHPSSLPDQVTGQIWTMCDHINMVV